MKDDIIAWLQTIEALKDVPVEQLHWLYEHSAVQELETGAHIFDTQDLIKGTFIIIEGKFRICIVQGEGLREVAVFEPKSITGYLPFSRGKSFPGFGEVLEHLKYLFLPVEKAEEMIRTQFELTQALVHVMTTRVRDFTAFQQQNEKMMALGKLSAGLAHELNNPAAAVVRGAASLLQHLKLAPETFKKIMAAKISVADVDYVSDKLFAVLCRTEMVELTMMQRSSLEDDLLDWMDEYNMPNRHEIAENLVDFGFTVVDLEDLKRHISAEALPPVLGWINNNLVTEKMVIDMEAASRRIADLVGAVKNFTHMDQGQGKQYADIHKGIRNTLTMLQHKIRHCNVQVIEQFDKTLPEVNAMIGELNQVWTNLIDNALDAMQPHGKGILEIKTAMAKDCVQVAIIDNGTGIPDDIKSRIFDPFYTTKEVGKGTGLGLDVVTRIVKQHQGAIKLNSARGRTEFIVEFPING
ncbi:MAG TPA: ATP-binding protein [Mucilaginibacter sp.]